MIVIAKEKKEQHFMKLHEKPEFKPQVRHQNKNTKKYFFGDFLSADF